MLTRYPNTTTVSALGSSVSGAIDSNHAWDVSAHVRARTPELDGVRNHVPECTTHDGEVDGKHGYQADAAADARGNGSRDTTGNNARTANGESCMGGTRGRKDDANLW